jgi:spore coat polysaccharide biosynthesis protein SpsF (cytidylyltransferase family)|tara:strand:- start:9861 stop:10613 length:753 start_codon:yes stop_codon:yes gene_type:complete
VQARMASTRLSSKVLLDIAIAGRPMLWYVVRRAQRATTVQQVVVATSDQPANDAVANFCIDHAIDCFRGSEDDVLDRYYRAARYFGAGTIVRITGDCPLIDPEIIDKVVGVYQDGGYDYVSNTLPSTYPDGLDTEVFSVAALECAWRDAKWRSEREHVTPYFRKHPKLFRVGNVVCEMDLSDWRWTVDELRDLEFVQAVYSQMGDGPFGMVDMLDLLRRHPELAEINAGIGRNEGYHQSVSKDSLIAREK